MTHGFLGLFYGKFGRFALRGIREHVFQSFGKFQRAFNESERRDYGFHFHILFSPICCLTEGKAQRASW